MTEAAESLRLSIGALGPTITEQLVAQGFATKLAVERIDRAEHAIHLLRIQGILTAAESDRAFKRLIKDLAARRAVHGVSCHKAAHFGDGQLHSEDDDTPYAVDGSMYCGRCHRYLPVEQS